MVRLEIYHEDERRHLLELPCPTYDQTPFVTSVAPSQARVAVVSTAGLHLRSDRPFGLGEAGYRVIPKNLAPADLVMSHVSTNFDRTGFQMDINMVLPLDRLEELADQGKSDPERPGWLNLLGVLPDQADLGGGDAFILEIVREPAHGARAVWSDRDEQDTVDPVALEQHGQFSGFTFHRGGICRPHEGVVVLSN